MSTVAGHYDLTATRGATLDLSFFYKRADKTPLDLTGYSARMHVRSREGAYGTSTDTTLLLEASTTNGMITIPAPTTGEIKLKIPPSGTKALNRQNTGKVQHVYALELFKPDGSEEYVIPLLEGHITIMGEVVR